MAHRIVFAGTPEFAVPVLEALMKSEHEVVAVYTQPDRPAGRGRSLMPSSVKASALSHGLPVCQPDNFKEAESVATLNAWNADVMVVAAYGLLLPQSVLDIPRHGCINVHASLLPRWRGASPIQQVILHGDSETGITIMAMVKAMDAGDMYHQVSCPILANDTAGSLHDRLAGLGPNALLDVLSRYPSCKAASQDQSLVTHAPKIKKQEAALDWTKSAFELERAVRAYVPWPVAYTHYEGERCRIYEAECLMESSDQAPGVVLAVSADGIDVQCGEGKLRIKRIQWPGGKIMTVDSWLNAHAKKLFKGSRFG